MKRDSTLFIESSNGNLYIIDLIKKEIFPCHKLIKCIYDLDIDRKGNNEYLYKQVKLVSKESKESEIKYSINKYLSLRNNGFFSSKIDSIIAQYSANTIQNQLENVDIVVFEVTEKCNLNCTYCINGTMYNPKRKIEHELSPASAHAFMEFLISTWSKSKKHTKCTKQVGFYGGEPLMNMPLIKDIVELCEANRSQTMLFEYRMTTNATLLDRYMEYLVLHKFNLTISLDGDKKGQSYRAYANGRNSFEKAYKNLKDMMNTYPDYWEKHITFNSVLHNRNTASSIHSFIYNEFGKVPEIHPLNNSGIMPNKKSLFEKMFRYYENEEDKHVDQIVESRFMSDPRIISLSQFLMWYNSNHFYNFRSILCNEQSQRKMLDTGTCLPFSRKIYLSAKNKIYPCERVNDIYYMGEVDINNKVILDTSEIARKYNEKLMLLSKQCNTCYFINGCPQCMFQLDGMKYSRPICYMHKSKQQMEKYLQHFIDLMESRHISYNRLLKEGALK